MSKPKTIKANQTRGKRFEDMIAEDFQARPSGTSLYDLVTDNEIIEVKSARQFTKDGNGRAERSGRFIIGVESHKTFKTEAERLLKKPLYIFVVYITHPEIEIIAQKTLDWGMVDLLLNKGSHWIRGNDNTSLVSINLKGVLGTVKDE